MSGRGQGVVGLVAAGAIAGGIFLAGGIGPAVPGSVPRGEAVSTMWLCPHGGGDGWKGRVAVANPGDDPVSVRLTSMDGRGSDEPVTFDVPAGAEVMRKVPADSRAASTYVEVFGGWAAAGWVVRAGGQESGSGAEPCAPAAARAWYTPEPTTQRGQQGHLVVMNPFASDAVFDVALYTPDRPPFRDPDWIDLSVPGGRSMSLRLDRLVPGEDVVAAEVLVKSGRVAVATVGVSESGGIRSTLGSTDPAFSWMTPTAGGTGQDTLVVFAPGELGVRFGTTLLSEQPPQPAGGLVEQEQALQSARAYPIVTSDPASVEVFAQGQQPVVVALRAEGLGPDSASTSGSTVPSPSWVVLPTADGDPSRPALVVVNPGNEPVQVTLRLLPPAGIATYPDVTLVVPPSSAAEAPSSFLRDAPDAAVLVLASGDVVAAGACTSGGHDGEERYSLALGVPVPAGG